MEHPRKTLIGHWPVDVVGMTTLLLSNQRGACLTDGVITSKIITRLLSNEVKSQKFFLLVSNFCIILFFFLAGC